MTWFFDQVYRSADVFDYGVERFESVRARIADGDESASDAYRTTVVVRRFGEAVFPVDVLVTFADGTETREHWDGGDRWKAFTYERTAPAATAQVDPERVLLLDINYTNNSRTLSPRTDEAATKWSLAWMIWLQDLMLTWGYFV